MAHQSVQCVKCEQYFDAMIPDAIVAGPFLLAKVSPAQ